MIKIYDFTNEHITLAHALIVKNYEEERNHVPVLPPISDQITFPDLEHFAQNGLGVVAFDNDQFVGFLCCYNPWECAFGTTNAKGTFSPIHGHGVTTQNREMIYRRLYQSASEKWVAMGISSHAIALYTHDTPAINSFFINGFGLRLIDAIRPMVEIECTPILEYSFSEISKENKDDTLPLKNQLINHLANGPTFLSYPQMTAQDLQSQFDHRNPRYFGAYYENALVAWVEIVDGGENFACDDPSMQNICGAYCDPERRGNGVFPSLVNYMITTLKSEGYTRLGVDFESFNPTAYGFWLKHFTAYTSSVVRRIDENSVR